MVAALFCCLLLEEKWQRELTLIITMVALSSCLAFLISIQNRVFLRYMEYDR